MLQTRTGNLTVYSLAIVLEDKPLLTDMIVCHPIEELPLIDGFVPDWKLEYTVTLPDVNGIPKTSAVKLDAKINAKWLAFGHSNRVTPPDVIKNETVLLFRYADNDEYWWTTIFHEPTIRRLERVRYEYGDLKPPLTTWTPEPIRPRPWLTGKGVVPDSCYWVEVSTVDKHVWLHTAVTDGEPFTYDIKINTKLGIVTFLDSNDNMIKLRSKEKRLIVKTDYVDFDVKEVNIRGDLNVLGQISDPSKGTAQFVYEAKLD